MLKVQILKAQQREAPWLIEARRILGSGIAALAVGASMALLAGCGQKGPLVLPVPAGAASAPTSANGAAR